MNANVILKIENLTFSYKNHIEIISNLNLELKKQSITALLGRNGCGKSTLFDCMLGLKKHISGNIELCDKNILEYTDIEKAKIISYVSQNNNISFNYKVYDFLSFARNPYISVSKPLSKNDYVIIDKYILICKIKHLINKNINEISGGERQLVLICRSLIQETDIIILDEPLTSLDYGNQIRIMKLLKELSDYGKTILFSIHNPMLLIEYNIYTVVMENGKIEKKGFAKDILNKENINTIYGIDVY